MGGSTDDERSRLFILSVSPRGFLEYRQFVMVWSKERDGELISIPEMPYSTTNFSERMDCEDSRQTVQVAVI